MPGQVGLPDSRPGTAGQRLTPEERLRRRTDYLRCYRTGRRRHGALAIVHFVPNQLGHPRIGITASRKVGKAVVRQRLKRRIKEIYRRWQDRSQLPALDLVIHLKPEAGKSDFPALKAELLRLFGEQALASALGRKPGAGHQTDRRLRPFWRRRAITARPFLVRMRTRKPWVRLRRRLLG